MKRKRENAIRDRLAVRVERAKRRSNRAALKLPSRRGRAAVLITHALELSELLEQVAGIPAGELETRRPELFLISRIGGAQKGFGSP